MKNVIKKFRKILKSINEKHKKTFYSLKKHIKKHHDNFTRKIDASGLKFSIFDSIEFVEADIWNSINQENDIFLSTEYLKALEKAPPENMSFKYAMLHEGNKPIAITVFQILTLDISIRGSLKLNKEANNKLAGKVQSKIKDNISHKMLICGNALLSGEHGFTSVQGTDQARIQKGISEVIERISNLEKISSKVNVVLIKDFYSKNNISNAVFNEAGYFDYFAGPNMIVPLRENWNSFNDYLAEMKAKYRKRVNSAVKKGSGMLRKSLSCEEIDANKDALFSLYLQVADKAKFRLFVLSPKMVLELKRFLKDKFILDAYYVENKIVAYTTRIINGTIMEGYSHGLEYDINKEYDIYQNILIDDIKVGINSKMKTINFGRTSIAMKSSLGAVPVEMNFLMQFKIMIPNRLIKMISFFFKPSDEHCRNPFDDNEN